MPPWLKKTERGKLGPIWRKGGAVEAVFLTPLLQKKRHSRGSRKRKKGFAMGAPEKRLKGDTKGGPFFPLEGRKYCVRGRS